jgi:outer membrane protein assembly factor BamB
MLTAHFSRAKGTLMTPPKRFFPQIRPGGLALFAAVVLGLAPAGASDWPQFLGPRRDGSCDETGLVRSWPAKGPPVLWLRQVGAGYSGPVVAGGRLILFHREDNKEVVDCLDAQKGTPLWNFSYACDYVDRMGKGDGPRSTPVVAGGRVYTLGVQGHLHCLDVEKGAKVWSKALRGLYNVPPNYFGIGTSPLVEGNLLLLNVGDKDAGIVALNKDNGEEVWRATRDEASYSSPVAATVGGVRHVIFFTRNGAVVLDPAKGTVRYQKRWRARYDASVNAATPLVIGDRVFFSASYDTGALLIRLKKDGADEVWDDEDVMQNHYGTCLHRDGFLYGFHGRQETGASLRCIDLKTKKVRWTREQFGCGSMVLAEGHLFILTERGDLVLAEATPNGYREKARASVFHALPCRAQIAMANGRLYARDESRLVCFDLKK